MTPRALRTLLTLGLALVAALALRLLITSGGFEWPAEWTIFDLRAHRAVSAATVGAALAVSGVLLQAMLRNPLASEYVLGLSAGAGLGVVVATYTAFRITGAIVSDSPPVYAPILGAAAALGLVYLLGRRAGLIDPSTLILVGVVVGIVCSALTTLVQHLLPDQGLAVYTRWLMGSISSDTPWPRVGGVAALTILGTAAATWLGPSFDAASLGDDEAQSVGLNLRRLRAVAFTLASALTGATILLAGPIGFLGLVCPHLVRRLAGPRHRALIAGSALCGGAVLLLADAGVTLLTLPTGHMPVGVLTALIGGPVFIVLLRRGFHSTGGANGGPS
jgi:iron complex transport system permease protein